MTKGTRVSSSILSLIAGVEYEVMPAEHGLPEQIDILSVSIELKGKNGRKRKVELIHTLEESEILQLEDEINEDNKDIQ
jgi:hypothetical protein